MLGRVAVVMVGIAVFVVATAGIEVAAVGSPPAIIWQEARGLVVSSAPLVEREPEPAPIALDLTRPVNVPVKGWMSWAALDTRTGRLVGSDNLAEPNWPMSMMKSWIAADYLATRYATTEPDDATRASLTRMILDSDNGAAREFWDTLGGDATMARMAGECGVTDAVVLDWSWSRTGLSARDAVRLGACIANGRAAGRWTGWLVDLMRHVRGDGDFGPRRLFADPTTVATKNGWQFYQGSWYINCLAMGDGWVLAIEQRWRGSSKEAGIATGDAVCQAVTRALLR